MKKFWLVWRNGGSYPKVMHPSKNDAIAEAERIAAIEQSSVFVLEAIGFAKPEKPPVSYTELKKEK